MKNEYTVPSRFLGHNIHAKESIGIKISSPSIDRKELENKTRIKSEIPSSRLILLTNMYPRKEKIKEITVPTVIISLKFTFLKNHLYIRIAIKVAKVEKNEIFPRSIGENFNSLVKK